MNHLRMSIRQILAIVALVGADLAIYRFATGSDSHGWNLYRLTALGPACLALNVAAFMAIVIAGRFRALSVGYLLFGLAAASSVLSALNDPPSETTTFSGDGSVEYRSYPGGAMARVWGAYLDWSHEGLHRLGLDYEPASTALKSTVIGAILILLPQFLIACVGGWAGGQFIGRRAKGKVGWSGNHLTRRSSGPLPQAAEHVVDLRGN